MFLTVSEFARQAGVSKQAIYSRLDSPDVQPYVKIDTTGKTSKKLIDSTALELFNGGKARQERQQLDSQDDVNLIQGLTAQLTEKDKQIEALLGQIQSLQEQNSRLSETLSTQSGELLRLLDQQQQLQAHTQLKLQSPPEGGPQEKLEPEPEKKKNRFFAFFSK